MGVKGLCPFKSWVVTRLSTGPDGQHMQSHGSLPCQNWSFYLANLLKNRCQPTCVLQHGDSVEVAQSYRYRAAMPDKLGRWPVLVIILVLMCRTDVSAQAEAPEARILSSWSGSTVR